MGKGERFRKWLAVKVWPEARDQERQIVELCQRLDAAHKRMQNLYWEGKAKEAAFGLIEILQEEVLRLDPDSDLLRKIREAAGGVQ